MYIKVIRANARHRETWSFSLIQEVNFVLEELEAEELPPKCRKWKRRFWYRWPWKASGNRPTPPPEMLTALFDHVRSQFQYVVRSDPDWNYCKTIPTLELPLPDPAPVYPEIKP